MGALMLLCAVFSLVVLAAKSEDAGYKEAADVTVNPRSDISEVSLAPQASLLSRKRRSVLGLCFFCCGCCKKMRGCGMCCRT